jgi:hypothetical protein
MGWLLSDGTAAALILLAALLGVSPRCRRPLVRARRGLADVGRRVGLRPAAPPPPPGRPIEVIAREARRLGHHYRLTRQGVSYAKFEAVRRAYDGVLAEGCDALGVAHLLLVLPPGEELDAERHRVERLLHVWGLDLDDVA